MEPTIITQMVCWSVWVFDFPVQRTDTFASILKIQNDICASQNFPKLGLLLFIQNWPWAYSK
jgi:hypothetical protein